MIKKFLVLVLLISSLTLIGGAYQERPTMCKSGCHELTPMDVLGDETDECGTCHLYVSKGKFEIQALEDKHNPNTCKLCHSVKDVNAYHTVHVNVSGSCNTCHGSTGSGKPASQMNDCAGCHGGQIHVIHQDSIDEICLKCHGKRPNDSSSSISSLPTDDLIGGVYASVVNYKEYTLYELIKRLFGL